MSTRVRSHGLRVLAVFTDDPGSFTALKSSTSQLHVTSVYGTFKPSNLPQYLQSHDAYNLK